MPMLSVSGLTKRFGALRAVNNVSFEVNEREIVGLIGPNGSGKSTTFNCIAGLYPPTAGSVLFEDAEIGGLAPNRICHKGIARTFQIPRPFHRLSILENVMLDLMYDIPSRDDVEECVISEEVIEQGSKPLLVLKQEAESA